MPMDPAPCGTRTKAMGRKGKTAALGADRKRERNDSGNHGTQPSCRRNEITQRRNHFVRLAGLQAAVRIDPEALGRECTRPPSASARRVCSRRDVGRVDVIDAGADLVRVTEVVEGVAATPCRSAKVSMVITSASMRGDRRR